MAGYAKVDCKAILSYWKKCVSDASCAAPKLIRDSKIYEERLLSLNQSYLLGQMPEDSTAKDNAADRDVEPICISSFQMNNTTLPYDDVANLKERIVGKVEKDEPIKILIAPFRIRKAKPKKDSYEAQKYYYPFWYPVEVCSNGDLAAPKYKHPFIPRKMLAPLENEKGAVLVIGESSKYDEECSKFGISHESFEQYIEAVKQFFFKVSGQNIDGFKIDDLKPDNTAIIVLDDGFSASHNIIRLYNYLTELENLPPLLNKLIEGHNPEERKVQIKTDDFPKYNKLLIGAMDAPDDVRRINDSSDSQKSALLTWFNAPDEKILAITGPPGTGKTYLLKNLVANSMVLSALNSDNPHVILVASGSNQAVNNVLSYLKECQKLRWLPDASTILGIKNMPTDIGLCVFMASKSAEESKQKNIFIQNMFQGTYHFYESTEYLEQAERIFVKHCHKEYSVPQGIKLSAFILNELKQQVSFVSTLPDETEFLPAYRRKVFELALHYWESKWLEDARVHIGKNISTPKECIELWQWRAMLTPCFAGTLHTLPDVFVFKEKQDSGIAYRYLTDFADTLIIDEAGQVTPEIGIPSFALAKRAIVLGDTQQIEPIWDITREVDKGNLQMCYIPIGNESLMEYLSDSGYLCSSGNLMKLTQNSTWIKSEIPGIPLKEHFRCYDEIIEFCNQLCYNYIEPQVGPSPYSGTPDCDEPFPPIQLIPINGISTIHRGHSRYNEQECYAVRQWLESNKENIQKKYGRIQDAVAILSPYKSQVAQIKLLLKGEEAKKNSKRQTGLENLLTYEDENRKTHEMVVGTVHSLQGSQRPIIIFSSVADDEDGLSFIDSHMINVAVSRAQKAFIAFVNPNILNKGGDYPMKQLNKYYQDLLVKRPEFITDNSYITTSPESLKWKKRIFISYRHNEKKIADKVLQVLTTSGYPENSIFYDDISIFGGDIFPIEIENAVAECCYFILLYSSESINRCKEDKDWVAQEILLALRNETIRIIPVNIDDCTPDWNWIQDDSKRLLMESTSWIQYSDSGFEEKFLKSLTKK